MRKQSTPSSFASSNRRNRVRSVSRLPPMLSGMRSAGTYGQSHLTRRWLLPAQATRMVVEQALAEYPTTCVRPQCRPILCNDAKCDRGFVIPPGGNTKKDRLLAAGISQQDANRYEKLTGIPRSEFEARPRGEGICGAGVLVMPPRQLRATSRCRGSQTTSPSALSRSPAGTCCVVGQVFAVAWVRISIVRISEGSNARC